MSITKEFTQSSISFSEETWNPEAKLVEEILVSIHWPKGYCSFTISYVNLSGNLAAKLEMWDDGWRGFKRFPELADLFYKFHSNSDKSCLAPDRMIRALTKLGFEPSEYHGKLNE